MSFLSASVLVGFHGAVLAATKKTTTSSGSYSYIIILVLLFGGYFFIIRPQRMRQRQQQQVQRQYEVGDEVVTTGGVIGRIREIADDRVTLEIAPGTSIEVLRVAIARRIDPPPPDDYPGGAPTYPNETPMGSTEDTSSPTDGPDEPGTPPSEDAP